MDKVRITCILNPIDPVNSSAVEIIDWFEGMTIHDCFQVFYPMVPKDDPFCVAVNHRIIEDEFKSDYKIQPGDAVGFFHLVKGGGGDKNILGTILMIAVVVAAAWLTGPEGAMVTAGWFAAGSTTATMVMMGIIAVGGLIVGALFPPVLPTMAAPELSDLSSVSPTYSWDIQNNPSNEGGPVPVLYGTYRVQPTIIGRYVEIGAEGKQYLCVLMAVADGAVSSISNFELNETPAEYFDNVTIETQLGSTSQDVISFFNDTRTTIPVQSKLTTSSVIRRTTGNVVEQLGIGISFPRGLYYANDAGGLDSQTVNVKAYYKTSNAATYTVVTRGETTTVTEYTGQWWVGYFAYGYWNQYPQAFVKHTAGSTVYGDHTEGDPTSDFINISEIGRFNLKWHFVTESSVTEQITTYYDYFTYTAATTETIRRVIWVIGLPPGEYDIKVRLNSAPASGSRYGGDCYWEYFEEVITDAFKYPGTALAAVRAQATDQLSGGMPRVTALVRRLYVSVYNPNTGLYESKSASNPAWACYDIIHNSTYGGGIAAEYIDYDMFATWADFCSSKGYTCNIYFDAVMTFRRALNIVSILGRATVIQLGLMFTVVIDRKVSEPVDKFVFNVANMAKDSFEIEFLPITDRANSIEITYFDASLNYTRQIVAVQSEDYDTTDMPLIITGVVLYGCTDRQQALNYGKALIKRNRLLTQTVSFSTSVIGLDVKIGEIIAVQHDVPQWGYGGRLAADATASQLRLDRDVYFDPAADYAVMVQHYETDYVEEVNILNPYSAATYISTVNIEVGETWASATPSQYALWSFGEVGQVSKLFQVIRIQRTKELTARIWALEYIEDVYNDSALIPVVTSPSDLPTVRLLRLEEIWTRGKDGAGHSEIECSWDGTSLYWAVYYRQLGNETWNFVGETTLPHYRISNVQLTMNQAYEIAVSGSRNPSVGEISNILILGKLAAPSDVTGFTATVSGSYIYLKWNHVLDSDLWGYEIRRGEAWEKSIGVIDGVQKNSFYWSPPVSGTYKLMIKAEDDSAIQSDNAAVFIITINLENSLNIIIDIDEIADNYAASAASLLNLVYLDYHQKIYYLPGLTDTDVGATFTDLSASWYPGDKVIGYYISPIHDIGQAIDFTYRMSADYEGEARNVTDVTYPSRTNLTYPNDTDVDVTSLSSYIPYYRFSITGASWTDWALWESPVDYNARYWQAKWSPNLESSLNYFAFTELPQVVDVSEVEHTLKATIIDSAGTSFNVSDFGPIFSEYYIGITVKGNHPYYPTTVETLTTFTVYVWNNAGAKVTATVDVTVRGF